MEEMTESTSRESGSRCMHGPINNPWHTTLSYASKAGQPWLGRNETLASGGALLIGLFEGNIGENELVVQSRCIGRRKRRLVQLGSSANDDQADLAAQGRPWRRGDGCLGRSWGFSRR